MKVRLPKGVGGGPQNMDAMMRQVQKFQEEREALAADLESREYDVAAGGGAVNLKIDGSLRVTEIKIEPEIIDPDDPETLEDIIVAAVNEALNEADALMAREMNKVTGGMNLGGLV